ncbi:hypothetical protein ACFVAJ_18780 [Agromyces sp. NPDC057679]|uniref:hypothetical protein n=1 Tax=Agromyces sp. NPDC057679 TaxID=3346207 RepID=UPI00367168D6
MNINDLEAGELYAFQLSARPLRPCIVVNVGGYQEGVSAESKKISVNRVAAGKPSDRVLILLGTLESADRELPVFTDDDYDRGVATPNGWTLRLTKANRIKGSWAYATMWPPREEIAAVMEPVADQVDIVEPVSAEPPAATPTPIPYEDALRAWGAKRIQKYWARDDFDESIVTVDVSTVTVEFEYDEGYACCGGRDPECYCSQAVPPTARVYIGSSTRSISIAAEDFDFTEVLREIIEAGGGTISAA